MEPQRSYAFDVPESRTGEIAEVAAEAFAASQDPLCSFIFEKEPGRPDLWRTFFAMIAGECRERSIKQASSPAMEAVAIWFPPGVDYSQDKSENPFRGIDFASPETGRRLTKAFSILTRMTAMLRDEAQWYLHLLAVRPALQGRGLASALIRPVLERADGERLPSSLVTHSSRNVEIYGHLGFRVVLATPLPNSDVTFSSMRRDPKK